VIVVDASAVIAILQGEPEGESFLSILVEEPEALIAAPTVFKTKMVAARNPGGALDVDRLLHSTGVRVTPWGEEQVAAAFNAFLRYGKGRHPAALNFGDCMAYALAESLDAPLLFKGADFAATDVTPAFTPALAGGA